MLRKVWMIVAVLTAALGVMLGATKSAHADTLKLGTLAPQDSPWGQVFKVWARNVDNQSNGAVQLDWQWGGTAGDENQMVSAMKSNQLDGAAITAVGLGQIYQDVLVFQIPGMFSSWDKLGNARNAVKSRLENGFDGAGFKILGWGDVGAAKIMSNGFAVSKPGDLAGKKTFYITGDVIGPEFFRHISGTSPSNYSVPEIFPKLQTGDINVLNAPPLAAEQLQWSGNITHLTTMTTGYGIGALVMSKTRFSGLPDDVKQVLADTGKDAANRLTTRIRALDAAAFAHLKQTKTAVDPSASDKAEWMTVLQQTQQGLRGNPFSADLFDAVKAAGQ